VSILVFNSGSSSLKFGLFDAAAAQAPRCLQHGALRLPDPGATPADHAEAALAVLARIDLAGQLQALAAIGHRVVHGGAGFAHAVRIDAEVLGRIEALGDLAPLHNPCAAAVIHACRDRLGPGLPMVAAFDTAFFHDLPEVAQRYALPADWTQRHGLRRYGFHGLAHRFLCERAGALMPAAGADSRLITLQLGHGCSVAAIRGTQPLDTSMGFTPLEGLIMGTRPGDLDAGILLHLAAQGLSPTALEDGVNRRAGLLGLSGASSEMDALLDLEADGHAGAALAVEAFCHRARKYLGAYAAVLGGVDAVVFGGGIGEHAPSIRARICQGLEWAGLVLDEDANRAAVGREARLSADGSAIAAYVVPVDEALLIAHETRECLRAHN
jgi:acetate kinase